MHFMTVPRHLDVWHQKNQQQRRRRRQTLNGRLPLKHRPDRPQTCPTGVSDDPRQFIFWRQKSFFRKIQLKKDPQHRREKINDVKLWTAVYPSNNTRIPVKLWQMAFQMIPDNLFFDTKNIFFGFFSASKFSFFMFFVGFWRSYMKTDVNGEFLAIFCSRYTYYELCTTKNCQNNV